MLPDESDVAAPADRVRSQAEGDRHDQQAAKHEANAGHGTVLGTMAETDPRDRFPTRKSPDRDPFSAKALDLAIVGRCKVRASSL